MSGTRADLPHAATLEIDLAALTSNYRLLKGRQAKGAVGAVVKANAYGLGMEGVSRALKKEGCEFFFVATLSEGVELRGYLPDAKIAVFNGPGAGEEKEYAAHQLIPTLNDLGQVERFAKVPSFLHVDTGMTRLGLNASDLKRVAEHKIAPLYLMSHLACADEPAHPKNAEQLSRFREALALFPGVKASLANSAAMFLSPDFHFDLARVGCALYGINPTEGANPMRAVATLSAPILQLRTLERDETVGYDATYKACKGQRVAIAGLGYSDGWFRSLGDKGFAYIAGHKVPIIGIISMDMMAIDVSSVPEGKITPKTRIEFLNKEQKVDDVAELCGTVGYEIFTRLGRRVERLHLA